MEWVVLLGVDVVVSCSVDMFFVFEDLVYCLCEVMGCIGIVIVVSFDDSGWLCDYLICGLWFVVFQFDLCDVLELGLYCIG